MGVIKRNKTLSFNSSDDAESIDSSNATSISFNRFLNSNSEFNSNLLNLNSGLSSEDEQQTTNNLVNLLEQRRKTPKKRKITTAQETFVALNLRGKSVRRKNRSENANFMANPLFYKLVNEQEIYKEIDIYDFRNESLSPFAVLMLDKANLKAWNSFINLSEDEQEKVLNDDENEFKLKKE